MEKLFKEILVQIGEDPERPGLKDTPKRAAKAMKYLTQGYQQDLDELVNGAIFATENDQMVVVKGIELFSMCEHHMLPFVGSCHAAYIPNGQVIGLSKIARIVDMYARRLQIQENLTSEIAHTIAKVIGTDSVAVAIESKHFCMMMRGVNKQNATMKTSTMLGEFKTSQQIRDEFFAQIQ